MPSLQYSDLSVDVIKKFHREHGGVNVELSPSRGELLLSLLDQRDRMERDLLTGGKGLRLLWDHIVWSFYESKARLFHKRLLTLQDYAKAVDVAHGWETSREGNIVFLLLPLK